MSEAAHLRQRLCVACDLALMRRAADDEARANEARRLESLLIDITAGVDTAEAVEALDTLAADYERAADDCRRFVRKLTGKEVGE